MSTEFKINADLISELAEAATVVASKDAYRPVLGCVRFRTVGNDTVTVEVTDSYRLMRLDATVNLDISGDPVDVLLNAKQLAAAVKPFRSAKKSDARVPTILSVTVDDTAVTFTDGTNVAAAGLHPGDYPDTSKIVDWDDDSPVDNDPGVTAFNLGYLADIHKVMRKFRGDNTHAPVRVQYLRTDKPSLFEVKRLDIIGDTDRPEVRMRYLLMPRRCD